MGIAHITEGKAEQTYWKGQNPGQTLQAPCQNKYAGPIIFCLYILSLWVKYPLGRAADWLSLVTWFCLVQKRQDTLAIPSQLPAVGERWFPKWIKEIVWSQYQKQGENNILLILKMQIIISLIWHSGKGKTRDKEQWLPRFRGRERVWLQKSNMRKFSVGERIVLYVLKPAEQDSIFLYVNKNNRKIEKTN